MPRPPVSADIARNRSVFVPLLAALTAVSGFIAIPAGPTGLVPIVLQNMFVLLCGAFLGPALGAAAAGLFLAAGALGLPVFGGGSGGFPRFWGPSGGYLAGYLLAAWLTGLVYGMPRLTETITRRRLARAVCAGLAGLAAQYALGLLRLYLMIKTPDLAPRAAFASTLAAGLLPFIPGDALKLALFAGLSLKLRPVIARFINPPRSDDATRSESA